MNINNVFDKYILVYRKLKSIFEQIYKEYDIKGEANPIEHIKTRIKKPESIKQKLVKKGYAITEENIDNELSDIVGVRIVCSFLSNLEILKNIVRKLADNDIFEIVEEKDYVTNPKEESGYSSYHIIVKVPVNYNDEVKYVNAEIQLRTIAMDMSASLEHKSCYKKEGYSESLKNMAKEATDFCRKVDLDLDSVVKSIDNPKGINPSLSYPFLKEIEFNLFKLKYDSALKFVECKLRDLYNRYDNGNKVNPIEHMKSRIKGNSGIVRKLISKNKPVNIENIDRYVKDFAGVRVVCSFLTDLDELKEYIKNDCDFKIIEEKDYVNFPKESGYRGYHFLVEVPVYTLNGIEYVKVEIQLRTVAMEMWASLEEKIRYHKDCDESVAQELQRISGITSVLDNHFDIIYAESKRQQKSNNKVRCLIKEEVK